MTPSISVIIPAYNEAERLPRSLKTVQDFLNSKNLSYEIIVVDDGSRDRTAESAKNSLMGIQHLILSNENNRGKGYCVRKGMLAASGKYLLFTDADLSTPIHELDRVLPHLEDGYDIVIGSRAAKDPAVKREMLWYREVMGRAYNLFAQLILFPGITDSQCGFKCFKHDVARDLFSKQKLDGFSFDGEILYLARKKGYRIRELAVHWFQAPKSKVKIISDSFRMFFELVKIKLLHR